MIALVTASIVLGQSRPHPLDADTWAFSQVMQRPIAASLKVPTIEFLVDPERVRGNGGVNSFGGTLKLRGKSMKISSVFSTKMAGSPDAMAQETLVFKALDRTDHWRFKKNYLELLQGKMRVAKLYRYRPTNSENKGRT